MHFFQRIGIQPFRVEYEKLCQDYEGTIRSVLGLFEYFAAARGSNWSACNDPAVG